MNGFIQKVREQKAPEGTAVLWWMGQMGLMIRMGGTVLCADYFATVIPERQVPPVLLETAERQQRDAVRRANGLREVVRREAFPEIGQRRGGLVVFVRFGVHRGETYHARNPSVKFSRGGAEIRPDGCADDAFRVQWPL